MTRHIVFDTETTGLSPENGDRIVEIGCVELVNRKPTGRHLHLYLNPERESDEGALRVHGLTTEFLSDKPKFAEVADEFLAFTAGADIVIHNAPFDLGFINHELARLGKPPFEGQVASIIDTLAMAKEMYPAKTTRSTACVRAWTWTTPGARCTALCLMPNCWPRCTSTSPVAKTRCSSVTRHTPAPQAPASVQAST